MLFFWAACWKAESLFSSVVYGLLQRRARGSLGTLVQLGRTGMQGRTSPDVWCGISRQTKARDQPESVWVRHSSKVEETLSSALGSDRFVIYFVLTWDSSNKQQLSAATNFLDKIWFCNGFIWRFWSRTSCALSENHSYWPTSHKYSSKSSIISLLCTFISFCRTTNGIGLGL